MNEFSIGSKVVIANTRFEAHKHQIGKKGVIAKFIKSRNLYEIKLEDSGTWQSLPENIKPV